MLRIHVIFYIITIVHFGYKICAQNDTTIRPPFRQSAVKAPFIEEACKENIGKIGRRLRRAMGEMYVLQGQVEQLTEYIAEIQGLTATRRFRASNGYEYFALKVRRSYDVAANHCRQFGGWIAIFGPRNETIHWELARSGVLNHTYSNYIGLRDTVRTYDRKREFVWNDGESMEHFWTNWRQSEPNYYREDCVVITDDFNSDNLTWNDVYCGSTDGFLCEREYHNLDFESWNPSQLVKGKIATKQECRAHIFNGKDMFVKLKTTIAKLIGKSEQLARGARLVMESRARWSDSYMANNGYEYAVFPFNYNYDHATDKCKEVQGLIAAKGPRDPSILSALITHFTRRQGFYIGLLRRVRQDTEFTWEGGVPMTHNNWMRGYPKFLGSGHDLCVYIGNNGRWYDRKCNRFVMAKTMFSANELQTKSPPA